MADDTRVEPAQSMQADRPRLSARDRSAHPSLARPTACTTSARLSPFGSSAPSSVSRNAGTATSSLLAAAGAASWRGRSPKGERRQLALLTLVREYLVRAPRTHQERTNSRNEASLSCPVTNVTSARSAEHRRRLRLREGALCLTFGRFCGWRSMPE